MRWTQLVSWTGIALFCMVPLQGQEKAADEVSEGFRAFIVNEPRFPPDDVHNRQGKMQDLVTEHGLTPVLAVFSKTIPPADATTPLVALVKHQDQLSETYKGKRLGSFLVFLSLKDEFRKDESRDARLKEIEQFVKGTTPKRTTIGLAEATVTPEGAAAPLVPTQVAKMGIEAEDDLVIVLYYKFYVVKRWKFKPGMPPGAAELEAITAEVEKLLGKKK